MKSLLLKNNGKDVDIGAIMANVPHRYPFLLVDRIKECTAGKEIVALKNVTINEPFFPGHFPGKPVMPGVLILEALAQAALLLGICSTEEQDENMLYYFVGIDKARFKRPVVPGDQLALHAKLVKARPAMWKFSAEARVDGQLACSAELMAAPRKMDDD